MRLVLIRHGRTRANEEHLYCGSTDLPLSENGRRELETLRNSFSYPAAEGFRFFTSGQLRTEQTLELIYGPKDHLSLPGIREMDFGRFEMRSYEQLKNDGDYLAWIGGDNEANLAPGGESGFLMRERVLKVARTILDAGEDAVVISHGGPIAAIMDDLFPEEGKNRYEWQPENGKGYLIQIRGGERSWISIPTGGDD